MIFSIRRFLLVNLLLSITLTTIVSTMGSLYLDRRDIQRHFDHQLIQITLGFEAVIASNLSKQNIQQIQEQIDRIPSLLVYYNKSLDVSTTVEASDIIQYQIWNKDGRLLLHSKNAPNLPFTHEEMGLSSQVAHGQNWRVFKLYNRDTGFTFVVTQRLTLWEKFEARIAKEDAFIVLTVYPLLGVVIWLIVGWGLQPIRKVAYAVSHRDPHNLQPFEISSVPVEIKPLVIELNHLFQRLQQTFEREKRFTADAAHELKTPLAILKTHAQLALKSTNPEHRQVALKNLIAGVDRSTHVVQQLLLLSRSEPGSSTFDDKEPVNLGALAANIIADLVPLALEKNIEIELKTFNKTVMISGNNTALGVLIRNLVDNAIRYTPENGAIVVTVQQSPHKTVLAVADNGPGVAPELHERVFERFFRVLGTKSSGSGLGLSIVKQIAELHNAKIDLGVPKSGKGLLVTITFPAKPQPIIIEDSPQYPPT